MMPTKPTRTLIPALSFVLVLAAGLAAPASAQIVHSLGIGAGVFHPRSFDTRVDGDVWVANLTQPDFLLEGQLVSGSLDFDLSKFRAMPIFGEWNVGIGNHLEVSGGVAYYGRKVRSRYLEIVNGAKNNAEIEQDLRLRAIPVSGVVRFLPFGQAGGFQPYVGVGVTAVIFRYTETGEFVDTSDGAIFNERYVAKGTAVGPVLLGGLRMPLGGDVYAFTIEGRYQWVDGPTGGSSAGFLGDRLDLSGRFVNFGLLVRF